MTRPDRRLLAAAHLVERLAESVVEARDHVRHELTLLDSHRGHTTGAGVATVTRSSPLNTRTCTANVADPDHPDELIDCGRPRPCGEHDTPVELTAVERAADQRLELQRWLADIETACTSIATIAHDALRNSQRILGTRAPVAHIECRDGQVGKDGAIVWGDPTCHDEPAKSGLCGRHYQAWYRWRRDNGVDTSRMFEPAGRGEA